MPASLVKLSSVTAGNLPAALPFVITLFCIIVKQNTVYGLLGYFASKVECYTIAGTMMYKPAYIYRALFVRPLDVAVSDAAWSSMRAAFPHLPPGCVPAHCHLDGFVQGGGANGGGRTIAAQQLHQRPQVWHQSGPGICRDGFLFSRPRLQKSPPGGWRTSIYPGQGRVG